MHMLITREVDYALRILRGLSKGEQFSAVELADNEQIPRPFAYKILKKLKNGKLVAVQRGAKGGYTLVAELRHVSLYDLLNMMENSKYVSACMDKAHQCAWRAKRNNGACQVHRHLAAIQAALDEQLKAYSLYDLISQ